MSAFKIKKHFHGSKKRAKKSNSLRKRFVREAKGQCYFQKKKTAVGRRLPFSAILIKNSIMSFFQIVIAQHIKLISFLLS